MFSHISWEQYFAYTAATGLLYYATVVFLYYRDNLVLFVKLPLRKRPSGLNPERLQRTEKDILGQAQISDSELTLNSEELNFYDSKASEEVVAEIQMEEETSEPQDITSSDQDAVENFTTELKGNLKILKEAEGNKEEFGSLFLATASKYPQLKDQHTLNALIEELVLEEELGFTVTQAEIEGLWL